MARAIIRAVPVFINGKKIAAISNGSYDIASGAESAMGAVEGYLGHLSGWPTVKVVPHAIVPVIGMGAAVESFLFDEVPFQIGMPINGRIHQIDVRVVGLSYRWDWKTGTCTGDISLEGGVPVLVGDIEQ